MAGSLFVAGGEYAEALELVEKQLDVETLAVQLAIERTEAGISTGMLANHGLQAALIELVSQFAAVVGSVSDESPTLRILDELLSNSGFVELTGPQIDNQRLHGQVHDDMNFRRKTATTATETIDSPLPGISALGLE